MSTIHDRIRQRREALGLSYQQVAEELGVPWQTIQQWERDPETATETRRSTAPKRTRMEDVARVFKTTVEWLQTGRDPSGGNLSPDEYDLVSKYRGLSAKGKDAAQRAVRDIYTLAGDAQRSPEAEPNPN